MRKIKQLVGSAESDDIGINVDDTAELSLAPKTNLCESVEQVATVHEIQVSWIWVTDAINGDHIVEQSLELGLACRYSLYASQQASP